MGDGKVPPWLLSWSGTAGEGAGWMGVVEDSREDGLDLSLWGKYSLLSGLAYPLLFHLLDTAAVMGELWDRYLIWASPARRCGCGCERPGAVAVRPRRVVRGRTAPRGGLARLRAENTRLLKAEKEWQLQREILRRAAQCFAKEMK
ncbi:HD domain-containing protein [Streptomyces sp. ME19-01-6]|uniref:HD domain-containing protein n=1 Tax=Streptomyces sp. ME19-01-6 TaxID=3028686 RepID=UPI0029AB029D|nr:HD domain-containing protein [Streptomyces sp. ME19-01-6]MDX3233778.1 HD domain-containing protein [Streptomyces sp. ME19-01-6]